MVKGLSGNDSREGVKIRKALCILFLSCDGDLHAIKYLWQCNLGNGNGHSLDTL